VEQRGNPGLAVPAASVWIVLVLVGIAGIGIIDYQTGSHVSLTLFYLVPVAVAAWWLGPVAAVVAAVLAAATSFWAEVLWYSPGQLAAVTWNAVTRLGLLGWVGWSLAHARQRVGSLERGQALAVGKLRASEDAARVSEVSYRALFNNMPEGVAYCRMVFEDGEPADFEYVDVNPAFREMTGLTDVVGKRVSHVIPGLRESNPQLFEQYARVVTTGHRAAFEAYIVPLRRWFAVSAYRAAPDHFVAVFTNITQRKQVEESLQLFRALIDRSGDGIQVVDPETGRLVDVNDTACADLGYSRGELLGCTVFDIDPSVDEPTFRRRIAELRKTGTSMFVQQGYNRRKDGSTFPVEVSLRYVRLDQDYVVAAVRDVTDRVEREAERIRLTAAIEQSADSIIITDPTGAIEYVNPAFEALTGYARSEVLGQNPRILKSDKQNADFYRDMWERLTRGEVWRSHFVNRRKDGTLYEQQASISAVVDDAGKIVNYVGVARDITRERSLEAQLSQAQRMESVGRLAGGVAHDFNNLLTVIMGSAQMLVEALGPDDPARVDVTDILGASGRAAALTRQLLAFSRRQVLEPQVVDLNGVVSGMSTMLRRLIGEDIELKTALDQQLDAVYADPGQLEQVIMNLAVNARDAMPEGGTLIIETANVELDEGAAERHVDAAPGRYVRLTMTDTGTGMADETKAHLFEPFYTTKERGRGTGLGLATVHGIIRQSGGHIWVYSEPGEGTSFQIHLPCAASGAAARPSGPSAAPAAGGTETILVAEDERAVGDLIERTLQARGYTVLMSRRGDEALKVAASHEGTIALLVTDVVMPGMGGRALAQQLEATRPDMRVLFISGYTDNAIVHQGRLDPGVQLLQKPFSPDALVRRVREVLDAPART
jgi:two-component system cell cycle sensor histidine kinase/response regulator CckA